MGHPSRSAASESGTVSASAVSGFVLVNKQLYFTFTMRHLSARYWIHAQRTKAVADESLVFATNSMSRESCMTLHSNR